MTSPALDWNAYFDGVAQFSGTLFALVLAARQIRGPVLAGHQDPSQQRPFLVDSIAVTGELGATALLAVLVSAQGTALFTLGVGAVALIGIGLSVTSAVCWFQYIIGPGRGAGKKNLEAWLQGAGNALPLAAYIFTGLYALGAMTVEKSVQGYAFAVSWLAFSGTIQAVLWYARMWDRPHGRASSGEI